MSMSMFPMFAALTGALAMLLAADVVWFLFRVIDVAVEYLAKLALRTESKLDDQLIPMIRKALKITIGVICGVWVIQLLGYSVSSLLAGLGIGGLAVALALQDALANFFGSVSLYIDRPFVVGDLIRMDGDVEGFVVQIGFRSTRLRTWPGTMVAIPNKVLANAVIDNWTRMPKRRVMHSVGLTYETTADQMEAAVAGIRSIIENDDGVDKEFIVVRFTEFADSSLNILVYYYTVAPDMPGHNETRERINLAIMRLVDEMGLSIAFPTRTVYFEGDIAKDMATPGGGEAKS
ncbi:MAG: mechanosensitive ion channel family protein [Planctomycetes bacterium]|nr:mechanosensitive ion channel family protein [Planctomycetota bacterium]